MSAWVEERKTSKSKRYYIGWRKNGKKQKPIPVGDTLLFAKIMAIKFNSKIKKYTAYKAKKKLGEAIKNASMD